MGSRRHPCPSLHPVTRALIALNIAGFVLQLWAGPRIMVAFALWPPVSAAPPGLVPFALWQPVTYAFLHGSLMHLLFNLLGLWMLGRDVEQTFGSGRYLRYYLTCVVSAALAQMTVIGVLDQPPHPTVGASGGVFGLLLAYGVLFPQRRLMLLFPPIPIRARVFVTLYGLVELFLGVTGTQSGVAHFAHLGGLVGGWLLIRHWRRQA